MGLTTPLMVIACVFRFIATKIDIKWIDFRLKNQLQGWKLQILKAKSIIFGNIQTCGKKNSTALESFLFTKDSCFEKEKNERFMRNWNDLFFFYHAEYVSSLESLIDELALTKVSLVVQVSYHWLIRIMDLLVKVISSLT